MERLEKISFKETDISKCLKQEKLTFLYGEFNIHQSIDSSGEKSVFSMVLFENSKKCAGMVWL